MITISDLKKKRKFFDCDKFYESYADFCELLFQLRLFKPPIHRTALISAELLFYYNLNNI